MSISIIRILGALFIFLCHACNESGSMVIGMLGQFFNVGVPIFFILSGYLHSQKTAPQSIFKWYASKLKRLLLPLYIFSATLGALYLIFRLKIDFRVWIQTLLPICGLTQEYIPGCGHLWFITHIMICYLFTPLLQAHRPKKKITILFIIAAWLPVCTLLAYTVPPIWCTLLNSLLCYLVGFYVLPGILHKRRHYSLLFCAAILSCGCRLLFRRFLDETPFYASVATQLCSIVLALSIITFLFQSGALLEKRLSHAAKRCITALSTRAYEFYLVHYVLFNGPLKIRTTAYLTQLLVTFALSVFWAEFVYCVSHIFSRKSRK